MPPLPAADAPFSSFTTPHPLAPGRYGFVFPDGWQQGRGLFGGLVVAALVRALEDTCGDAARPLRTLTASLCGPTLPGEAEVHVEALRLGSGVSTLAARLVQEGQVQAHAVAVFGKQRPDALPLPASGAPTLPAWDTVEVTPVEPPLGPHFARYFEFRPVDGLPFSQPEPPACTGYIRPRHPGPRRDAAFVAACADAWWPVAFTRLTDAMRPMATVSYTLHLAQLPDDPHAPLVHRAREVACTQGYSLESRELWTPSGRLVALNHQAIAIIR